MPKKKKSKKGKVELPQWDYKENLYLERCSCTETCQTYFLYVDGYRHGELTDNFKRVACFTIDDLYDIYWNVVEKLEIEHTRVDLNKQFKKEKN